MCRLLAMVAVGLLAATAVADLLPPKGQKRVPVDHKITTEKEIDGYRFYTVIGRDVVTAVKFGPKTPIEILGAGRPGGIGRSGQLVAVPDEVARNYASDKELVAAIAGGKVDGLIRSKANFDSFTMVNETDKRASIVREYSVEKIDAKEGIVLKPKVAPKSGGAKNAPPEDDSEIPGDTPAAHAPHGGAWIAGAAAFAAVTLGGFWLAGRTRRKA